MRVGKKVKRTLGAMLFTLGFLIGLVVFVGAVWADFEAAMFDMAIKGDESLGSVRWPGINRCGSRKIYCGNLMWRTGSSAAAMRSSISFTWT